MKVLSKASVEAHQIFRLIEPEVREVEARLKTEAVSKLKIVGEMNRYLHESGGKRLRPSLLLLVSKMLGADREPAVQLGVVVELIHVATLVHDDIIDNANVRRGRRSLNSKWGNDVTVLFGDWLYMTAFWIALQQRDFRILDVLIDLTRTMVEGELIQLEQNYQLDTPVERYLKICWHKTAHLFSGCSRLGAILSGASGEQEEKLARYGESLGMAFQLIDDLLDYTSDQKVLGKPVLKDLEEGNITLPVIRLMEKAEPEDRDFVRAVVEGQDFSPENKQQILQLIQRYETLDDLRSLAEQYASEALGELAGIPDSEYRDALTRIPDLVISRQK